MEFIFKSTIVLHGKKSKEDKVVVDTTVSEKNITSLTYGKLAIKMINHIHKIAKNLYKALFITIYKV